MSQIIRIATGFLLLSQIEAIHIPSHIIHNQMRTDKDNNIKNEQPEEFFINNMRSGGFKTINVNDHKLGKILKYKSTRRSTTTFTPPTTPIASGLSSSAKVGKTPYSWEWQILKQGDSCVHATYLKDSPVYKLYLDRDCDEGSKSLVFVRILPYDTTPSTALNSFYPDHPDSDYKHEEITSDGHSYFQAFTWEKRTLGCMAIEQSRPLSSIIIGDCYIVRPVRTFELVPFKSSKGSVLFNMKGVLSDYPMIDGQESIPIEDTRTDSINSNDNVINDFGNSRVDSEYDLEAIDNDDDDDTVDNSVDSATATSTTFSTVSDSTPLPSPVTASAASTTDELIDDVESDEEPIAIDPAANEPITNEPVINDPITNDPITNEAVTNEPIPNEPIPNEPITNEPVTNEPVTNEPVTNEPVTNEPVTNEPITNEPVTNEPVTNEPVTNEPVIDEPVNFNEEPLVNEEPGFNDPVVDNTDPEFPDNILSGFDGEEGFEEENNDEIFEDENFEEDENEDDEEENYEVEDGDDDDDDEEDYENESFEDEDDDLDGGDINLMDYRANEGNRFRRRPSKEPVPGESKAFTDTICFETTTDSKQTKLVESRKCWTSKDNDEIVNNQIYYFDTPQPKTITHITKFLTRTQKIQNRLPATDPHGNFRIMNAQFETCLGIVREPDLQLAEGELLYNKLITRDCFHSDVLYFWVNEVTSALETYVNDEVRCIGTLSANSTERVRLVDCIPLEWQYTSELGTEKKLVIPEAYEDSAALKNTQWFRHGHKLKYQQLLNMDTNMCMDVEHSQRDGEVIQFECKDNTGYKPANQLFIFSDETTFKE